jgi:hypothetical protein
MFFVNVIFVIDFVEAGLHLNQPMAELDDPD